MRLRNGNASPVEMPAVFRAREAEQIELPKSNVSDDYLGR